MTFDQHNKEGNDGVESGIRNDADSGFPPQLKLKPEDYIDRLGAFDMSEAQKVELLQTLWNIMATLVDIGFGVDTVQYLLPDIFEKSSQDSGNLLEHNHPEISDNDNL